MSPAGPQNGTPPPVKVRAEIGDEKRMFTFDTPFRIGRTDECEICIKNEHVSRKHVEVLFENGTWLVRDLNSANGIFVNGERVQSVPLFTGLKIQLGIRGPFVEMLVTQPAAPPAPPPEKKLEVKLPEKAKVKPQEAPKPDPKPEPPPKAAPPPQKS